MRMFPGLLNLGPRGILNSFWMHTAVTTIRPTFSLMLELNYYTPWSIKNVPLLFFDNSGKYWWIFVFFSLLYSGRNCGI